MKIEVPADQYSQAIEYMKTRISNGQVPGASDPNMAYDIIRKGKLTYNQALNLAKSYLQGCHKEKPPEKDGFNYSRYSPRPEGGSLGYSSSSKLSNGPLRPERWSLVYSTFSSTPFSISFLACAECRAA